MSRKAITYEDRVKVVHFHQEGKSAREIGKIIAITKFGAKNHQKIQRDEILR